jgi:tRNA pseudouridine65 synthase
MGSDDIIEACETLWEDARFLAVLKPAGVFTHDTDLHRGEPSVTALLRRARAEPRLSPVHRLDKPTSGVLLFAKDSEAASLFGRMLAARDVDKRYDVVVRGALDAAVMVDHPLREEEDDGTWGEPRPARTLLAPRTTWEFPFANKRHPSTRLTHLEASPATGRRHQIRRHCKHLSHPIVGDTVYGSGEINLIARRSLGVSALLLHARVLRFMHPVSGEEVLVEAPEPPWLPTLRAIGRILTP